MKDYLKSELELVMYKAEDTLTTSGNVTDEGTDNLSITGDEVLYNNNTT